MKYKAIIIDLDGTAVDTPGKTMPSVRLKKAIERLEELGIKVCAATGRSRTWARHVVERLGLIHPTIVSGGTQIISEDYKRILKQSLIEKKLLHKVLKIVSPEERTFLWNDYELSEYLEDGAWPLSDLDTSKDIYFFEICFLPEDDAARLLEEINDISGITATMATAQRPHTKDIHITADSATKEHAIEELAKMIGVPQEQMIGVGDGANDIHLFNAVGHKVAMANAVDELKDQADEIIGDIKDDGLAEYFERLIKEIENDHDKSLNLKDIEVVQPEAEDALPLAKMHAQSWRDSYVGINGSTIEWVEERMKNRASKKGLQMYREAFEKTKNHPDEHYYRLAKINDQVVGFVEGMKQENQEVGTLYVSKEFKGTGLAQKMMDGLMSWFDLSKDIEFAVVRDNTRAVNFYESYGFKIVESDPKDYERYLPLIVVKMKRRGDKI